MEEKKELIELLKKVEESNRQQTRFVKIQCILTAATLLCCLVVFIMVANVLPQILPKLNAVTTQLQTVLSNVEQVTEDLANTDLESMIQGVDSLVGNVDGLVGDVGGLVDDVDVLVASGQDSLRKTMDKLNAINFETLNQAIEDLAAVVEPLAKFFNVFN